jgi:hypothetical protein
MSVWSLWLIRINCNKQCAVWERFVQRLIVCLHGMDAVVFNDRLPKCDCAPVTGRLAGNISNGPRSFACGERS